MSQWHENSPQFHILFQERKTLYFTFCSKRCLTRYLCISIFCFSHFISNRVSGDLVWVIHCRVCYNFQNNRLFIDSTKIFPRIKHNLSVKYNPNKVIWHCPNQNHYLVSIHFKSACSFYVSCWPGYSVAYVSSWKGHMCPEIGHIRRYFWNTIQVNVAFSVNLFRNIEYCLAFTVSIDCTIYCTSI